MITQTKHLEQLFETEIIQFISLQKNVHRKSFFKENHLHENTTKYKYSA